MHNIFNVLLEVCPRGWRVRLCTRGLHEGFGRAGPRAEVVSWPGTARDTTATEDIHLPAGCSGGVSSLTIFIEQNCLSICSCVVF